MRLACHKFKSPLSMEPGWGSSPRERGIAISRPLSVSQEYKAALRTDSYEQLWSKVQTQLVSSTSVGLLSSVSSRNLFMAHFSETLLEPGRETLAGMIESLRVHHLLVDYFEASSEACDVCELLLVGVYQTRANYKRIRRVIRLTGKACDCSNSYTDGQCKMISREKCEMISRELGAFSSLRNPLSVISPVKFNDMSENYTILLRGLTRKCKKIRKKARLYRFGERAAGCCLVVSRGVIGIASIALAVHGAVGVVAAPGVMSPCVGLGFISRKKEKLIDSEPSSPSSSCPSYRRSYYNKTHTYKRLISQLNVAARGLYVLINDMDTMGSLVGRLQDEVDHTRAWADTGAKNSNSDRILKEVVRGLELNSTCFMEQLEELEEHIYLCLLAINKSRRSLLEEITASTLSEEGGSNNTDGHGPHDSDN